mgnify:CR=1 FL=1
MKNESKNNFIVLTRKTDFADFFKNGWFKASGCPYIKFNVDVSSLNKNNDLALNLFKKANPIDYSTDYILLHICKRVSRINILNIKDVVAIYSLDNNAYSIGINLEPAVTLCPPIWQEAYEEFQVQCSIKKALEGVKLIEELLDIHETQIKNLTQHDIYDTFKLLYHEQEPYGEMSPWTYLLRYERHENYPKDTRGYFIDALHVFGNISKKTSVHMSMIEKSNKGKEIANITHHDFSGLCSWIKEDTDFIKLVKQRTGNADFIFIAALFLSLKDKFKEFISNDEKHADNDLSDLVDVTADNVKYLKPSLYLLGLTLGWNNLYKFIYQRWGLNILAHKKAAIIKYPQLFS